ncbi:MAG: iron-containing alcohol dehydrogenase [Pseudomonadota bacterium]
MNQGHVTFGKLEEVIFGQRAGDAIGPLVDRLGARRVLLMVSGTLRRETHEIARLEAALDRKVAGVFDGMPAHSPRSAVLEAARMARDANADLVVTLGGGSITDAAKAVRLALSNDIHQTADFDRLVGATPDQMTAPVIRQVSIPTTLSGGEFSGHAGVTDETTGTKYLHMHPMNVPTAVILDPSATVHTPEWLWLSTGIRAVDHCVEGVCSGEAHPYGDAQGLKGLSLLANGLAAVKADPSDLEARLSCQIGTWLSMGPLTSGVPMGASHGIGYVLGAKHGVPHGHTSCIMLPAVMRWNAPVNADRQRMVATAMGEPQGNAADLLHQLVQGLGMPRTLREVGITRDNLAGIAEGAMGTPWVPRNPRPIPGPDEVLEVLELAY